MRIKKVKIKGTKITMAYEKRSKLSGLYEDEYSFSCSELAKPEFYQALQNLAQDVLEMCEIPVELDRITVRGVSYSYGGVDDTMGATISAAIKLDNSYPDLNINTPHKACAMYSPDTPNDEMQLLSGDCVGRLEDLEEECMTYIRGDRAQGSLFLGEDEQVEAAEQQLN